ncbi:hypothetical protein Anapl_14073 [Anas platyrhynchos]|uniref:Ig-like domain-containing protein n=1 Tax=Anas platyrhynchos TaxID=8839 RepID=R0LEY9_ANAPL|nr:hypothetical protein Anapl_14073 [Anas platyrhynchos]
MLTCEANFQGPLSYVWKITGRETSTGPKVLIPKENVDTGGKATCIVTYFEVSKSSEITLDQCSPNYQAASVQSSDTVEKETEGASGRGHEDTVEEPESNATHN